MNSLTHFYQYVDKQHGDGCWLWVGGKDPKGYGMYYFKYGTDTLPQGKQAKAHRASYILHVGDIPEGMTVRHKCDNPSCVNPSHLVLGTHQQNMDDKVRHGRHRKQHKVTLPDLHNGDKTLVTIAAVRHAIYLHRRGVDFANIARATDIPYDALRLMFLDKP